MTNLPNLVVKQPVNDWFYSLPTPASGANTWPTLVAFVNGDFIVSDMGINIIPFRYDGHMCQIVETDHDGYVMYDGFVDDEQICRDQPTEAEARHAVICYVRSKAQNKRYAAPVVA